MARPTLYKKEYDEQVYKLCLLGATDAEIADFFNVNEDTINVWKIKRRSFSESMKRSKKAADAEVASKLFERATGYNYNEQVVLMAQKTGEPVVIDTVRHSPPDIRAMQFWLKNRQSKLWRDKSILESLSDLSEAELDLVLNRLILKNEQIQSSEK